MSETSEMERPVWGAEAIGQVIGRNRNQTFHLLVTGKLPATKVGDSWVAMPSELLRVCGKSSAAAA